MRYGSRKHEYVPYRMRIPIFVSEIKEYAGTVQCSANDSVDEFLLTVVTVHAT
jgi:hypothetical protein